MRTSTSNQWIWVFAGMLPALGAGAGCGDDTAVTGATTGTSDGGAGGTGPGPTSSSTQSTSSTSTSSAGGGGSTSSSASTTSTTSSSNGGGGAGGDTGAGGAGGAEPGCGDGIIDAGEECEGADLDGATCESEGFVSGTLGCDDTCQLITTGCETCGDDAVNGADECDGADLDGQACTDLNFDGGTLACANDCTFDTAGCTNANCGDDIINGSEDCEIGDLGGATCEDEGFSLGGVLDCADNCTFDTAGCLTCGDDIVNGLDACDGDALDNATCLTLGHTGGTLACSGLCAYDESGCTDFVQPALGEVVISELMINPTGVADATGEWIEIHNPSATESYQLAGCIVSSNNDSPFAIDVDLLVSPGEAVTLARSAAPGFTPDFVYPSAFALGNTTADFVTLTCGAVAVDTVAYSDALGFTVPGGASLSLDPASYDVTDNDAAASWCTAATTSAGFTSGDLGTPGELNAACGGGASSSASTTVASTTNASSSDSASSTTVASSSADSSSASTTTAATTTAATTTAATTTASSSSGGNDPVVIGFCRLQFPATITQDQGTSVDVFGRVFVAGLTDVNQTGNDVSAVLVGEVGFGPDATDPVGNASWSWVDAAPNAGYNTGSPGFEANNDEYVGTFDVPGGWYSPYDYAFRFSGDNGVTWTYCDLGAGSSDGYSAVDAGAMVSNVTPGGALFFSEYVEGTGSNKALELFNASAASIDLSTCEIRNYNNGDNTPTFTFALTGTIDAGETFVICDDAQSDLAGLCDLETNSNALNFNGDDAVAIACGNANLDVIGVIGTDPGSAWGTNPNDTADVSLRRDCGILAGDTNGADAFTPDTQWSAVTYVDETSTTLGSHTAICLQ